MRAVLAAIAVAAAVSACGAEPTPPPASPAGVPGSESPGAAPASDGPSAASGGPDSTAPASSAAAAPPPKPEELPLANESAPPGTQPLTEDEKAELKKSCKGLIDSMEAAAKKKKPASREEREAFLDQFLSQTDKAIKGVDVPRCAALMLRDVRVYRARTIEVEAHASLGAILVGLASALENDPPVFCPSAPPIPAKLEAVQNGTYTSKPADWRESAWKCTYFGGPSGPQRFQYELKSDPRARTFEIIARGFPVPGAPATELLTRGEVKDGKIQPTRQVWRRR